MVLDFTARIKLVDTKKDWTLTGLDRCDACGAQAYVHTIGVSGDLFFCGHHYEKAIGTPSGYDNMMKFAYSIIDERDRLIQNKSQGDDY